MNSGFGEVNTVPPFDRVPEYEVKIETFVSGGENAEALRIGENVTITRRNENTKQVFLAEIVSPHPICE